MLALTLRRHAQTLEGLAVSRQVQFLEPFSKKAPFLYPAHRVRHPLKARFIPTLTFFNLIK